MEDDTFPRRFTIWHPPAEVLKIARWLAKGTAPDRHDLGVIARHGDALVACDGVRLQAVEAPDGWPDARYVRPIFIPPTSKGPLILEEEEHIKKFPDFSSILPHDEPSAIIALNPVFLRDALNAFIEMAPKGWRTGHSAVLLRFYGKRAIGEAEQEEGWAPIELCSGVDGGPYVLIMPMHYDRPDKAWRPKYEGKEVPVAEEPPSSESAGAPQVGEAATSEGSDVDLVTNAGGTAATGA